MLENASKQSNHRKGVIKYESATTELELGLVKLELGLTEFGRLAAILSRFVSSFILRPLVVLFVLSSELAPIRSRIFKQPSHQASD